MTIYGYRNFNNYYNRRVKGQSIDNITDFMEEFGEFNYIQTDTYGNFNEKDGVATTHVLGNQNDPYFGDCDYLLVCNDNNEIDSRWFIVDQDKICYGQYKLALYRDVIVDNWNNIITAPMFIEKATLQDSDPLIYNQEAITTNQIKQSETLLKDESECGWLIGYLNKEYANTDPISIIVDTVPDLTVATQTDINTSVGAYVNTNYRKLNSYKLRLVLYHYMDRAINPTNLRHKLTLDISPTAITIINDEIVTTTGSNWCYTGSLSVHNFVQAVKEAIDYTFLENNIKALPGYNVTACNNIYQHQNEVYYITDTQVYKKVDATITNVNNSTSPASGSTIYGQIYWDLDEAFHGQYMGSDFETLTVNTNDTNCVYDLTTVPSATYSLTIGDVSQRIHCKDVYDLFCIPYGDIKITNSKVPNWTAFTYNKDEAISIMQGIAVALGSNLYDVQLVPYCPLTGLLYSNEGTTRVIDINNSDSSRYKLITINSTPKGIIIFSASNKGTKDIACNLAVTNKKIQNQTQIVRLSSPNYSAQFDFNIAKNNGVNYFNVDYNYLPYRPYIHIAPIWNVDGIYGGDYNDAKGLICGGDFSISYLSDAWVNYQVQNKNYEDIFNRGTQNLETNYKYQRIQSILNTTTGGLGGALTGATTGALLGGPVGGVIGGLAGSVLSAGAGIADLAIQQNLHNEAMDYRKDLYEMQLDNIKALPDTIKKVTAINENNKIFPFIEIYDCTDREKIAVANKIAWNGMTVGAIGTLQDYIYNSWSYGDITDKGYVKGQLIRAEGICDDTHMINAIADELNKGVFTK